MANKVIILKVIDNSGNTSTVKVLPGASDQTLRLQASAGSKYIVMEETTKFAPKEINVQKSGQDLLISFTEANKPDVIIEQYYDSVVGKDSVLLGQHENGQYYTFVPTSGQESETIYMLPEYVVVSQALGGDPVDISFSSVSVDSTVASTSSLSPTVLNSLYLGGAGLLGGAVGASFASHGDKSTDDTDKLKDELNNKIDELKDKIEQQGGAEDELDRLKDKLTELNDKLDKLEDKLDKLEDEFDNPPPLDNPDGPKIDNSFEAIANPDKVQSFNLKPGAKEEIIFKLLAGHEDENFGGFNNFFILQFHIGKFNEDPDADRIVLKDIIVGDITPNSPLSELEKYFQVDYRNWGTVLNIDSDGDNSKYTIPDNTKHIVIYDEFSLQELIENGQLVWM